METDPGPDGRTSLTELRVRYAETDTMGVVYYANYLIWFELGRTDWIRAHGVSYREFEEQGVLLPVVEARCSYKASARYDDVVRIATTVTALTPARISFSYRVTRPEPEGGETLLAEGATDHVFMTRDRRIARLNRHPELWSRLTSAFAAAPSAPPKPPAASRRDQCRRPR
jgi:acyl-CoA thioester hydrolase